MKQASFNMTRRSRIATRAQRTLLPLVAMGGSLASLPASGLELGDLTVQSKLGQPLRASIAFALAPNEQLTGSCVTLGTGAMASGLPGIGRATISIANGSIVLTGKTAIREPLVATQVVVDCVYTPNLSREYVLFIDPAGAAQDEQAAVQAAAATPATPERRSTAVARRPAPTQGRAARAPIGKSTRYQVQPGDSLSRIAERIENRPIGLWQAVTAIFEANPDAFMDNDPNKLKAGSWLAIPSFDGSEPRIAVASSASVATSESLGSTESTSLQDAAPTVTSAETPPVDVAPAEIATALRDATADLSPGNFVVDTDNPFVDGKEPASGATVIPDTELAEPVIRSSSPNVPTAVINTRNQASTASTTSWLLWLTGGGIAIIIGLLLFGRLLRGRPDAGLAEMPMRRAADKDSGTVESIPLLRREFDDDAPTEENLALDADLVVGTGLGASGDMDIASDFGFGSPTELDIELPFEPEASIPADSDTSVIPALHTDEQTILDSEILPDDENYDLSVILDATKMPQSEDVTARDLQAIDVTPEDTTATTDAYSINQEVDLDILEQDYEDELTATQALNSEIKRAAAALANDLGDDDFDDGSETCEMEKMPPLATVTDLETTAQMPTSDADDEDETGIHEAATVEMPAAENDETVEMDIGRGKSGTKGA